MEMTIYWDYVDGKGRRLHYVRVDGLKSNYLTFDELIHALAEYNLTDVWPLYMRFGKAEQEQIKQIENKKEKEQEILP